MWKTTVPTAPWIVQVPWTTNLWIRPNIPADKKKQVIEALESLLADPKEKREEFDKKIEAMNKVPVAVEQQWKESTEYFINENEREHIAVVEHIQNLVRDKKIMYKDTWKGTYEVNVNLPWCSMKIYMPEDETIVDVKYNYKSRNDSDLPRNEITKGQLQSEEGKKYLKEKEEKEHKRLMSKAEMLKLWKALYPNSEEEEQILAIMQATWFYGWIWLSDVTEENYQLAVICSRKSDNRKFSQMYIDNSCGLVYTAAV